MPFLLPQAPKRQLLNGVVHKDPLNKPIVSVDADAQHTPRVVKIPGLALIVRRVIGVVRPAVNPLLIAEHWYVGCAFDVCTPPVI